MKMIRHQHVSADPYAVGRTLLGKSNKRFVNVLFREEWSALRRASRQEVNGSPHINAIEASEAIRHSIEAIGFSEWSRRIP